MIYKYKKVYYGLLLCFILKLIFYIYNAENFKNSTKTPTTSMIFVETAYAEDKNNTSTTGAVSSGLTEDDKPDFMTKAAKSVDTVGGHCIYSDDEIKLLKMLADRRQELDQKEKNLEVKQNLVTAMEQNINKKLDDLKQLKQDTSKLLEQYNAKESEKIQSLVKIYQNMDPKDAAKIFQDLDMPILLEVISHMKEAKVAPILGLMKPEKAREISTEYANQKQLTMPQ